MDSFIQNIDMADRDELLEMRSIINDELSRRSHEKEVVTSSLSVCNIQNCPCTFKLPYGVSSEDVKRSDIQFNTNQLVVYGLSKDENGAKLRREIIRCLGSDNQSTDIRVMANKGIVFLRFHNHERAASAQTALVANYKVNFSVTPRTMTLFQTISKKTVKV